MKIRILLIIASSVACAATVTGVVVQGRQLGELRTEHRRLVTEPESEKATAPNAVPAASNNSPSLELLQLRNEVSQLTKRRRELNNIATENETLRVQVAVSRTNTAKAGSPLAGYIRKSTAQNLGFNTPEDTLQTFYWAIHNRDITTLTQAFGPEMLKQLQRQIEKSGRTGADFFKGSENIPPMRVLDREQLPGGSVKLKVGNLPGAEPAEQTIHFQFINGQWKLDMK
jgi:hypothetical protein